MNQGKSTLNKQPQAKELRADYLEAVERISARLNELLTFDRNELTDESWYELCNLVDELQRLHRTTPRPGRILKLPEQVPD